jgi:hypothetical protein
MYGSHELSHATLSRLSENQLQTLQALGALYFQDFSLIMQFLAADTEAIAVISDPDTAVTMMARERWHELCMHCAL